MTEQARYQDYDRFAWIYNQHWGGFSELVLPLLDQIMLKYLPEGASILDVACGTGHVTRGLLERGYRVTGLDGSEEMLHYARQNAPQAELLLEDARTFSLASIFDGAVSTFDSLNHILAIEELEAVFRNVLAALKPGGRFVFDLNMEPGLLAGDNGSFGDSFEEHAYIWKNSYLPDEQLGRFDGTLFRLEEGVWQRSDVTLWQRCYPIEVILNALRRAGFRDLQAFQVSEELALIPLNETGLRGFFTCRKE